MAGHLAAGLLRRLPQPEVAALPIADGGDGTVEAVVEAGFAKVPAIVSGPTGERVEASFAVKGRTAIVELAEGAGLRRLPGGTPEPLAASSRGAGELILAALDGGCDRLVLGMGGSACTDGGAGMLHALGARVLDRDGRDLAPGGGALASAAALDLHALDPRLVSVEVVLASDVDNPLLGTAGAAAVFAPQKGASAGHVRVLESGLRRWKRLVDEATGTDLAEAAGAGAAGGTGYAALAVLGAHRRPGAEVVLELLDFESRLAGVDLVVTGEGRLDTQTLHGKAPLVVARRAAAAGVPTVAVVGSCTLSPAELRAAGFETAYSLTSIEPDLARCRLHAGSLVERLAEQIEPL